MLLVFVLGMRHGLDADHLVAIDGLTRLNASANPWLARRCGALFSLGHGIIVMLTAVAVALFAQHFTLPPWLADLGVWLSIALLLALGVLNQSGSLKTLLAAITSCSACRVFRKVSAPLGGGTFGFARVPMRVPPVP